MHFYRPLRPLAALTFDLDDTLYDNRPVIRQTEQQSVAFLQSYHPGLNSFQSADFHRLRQSCANRIRRFTTTSPSGAGAPFIWR